MHSMPLIYQTHGPPNSQVAQEMRAAARLVVPALEKSEWRTITSSKPGWDSLCYSETLFQNKHKGRKERRKRKDVSLKIISPEHTDTQNRQMDKEGARPFV